MNDELNTDAMVQELSDNELGQVSGGMQKGHAGGYGYYAVNCSCPGNGGAVSDDGIAMPKTYCNGVAKRVTYFPTSSPSTKTSFVVCGCGAGHAEYNTFVSLTGETLGFSFASNAEFF